MVCDAASKIGGRLMLSFFVRILGLNLLLLLCWPLLIGTWQRRRHVLLKALGLLN